MGEFERTGVVHLQGLLSSDEAQEVRRSALEHLGQRPSARVIDLWRLDPAARMLACHPRVITVLEGLFEARAIPFQTLTFGVGTGQPLHADSVHFDSFPAGLMCGVWVALEDVGASQGPLVYVPGSHLLKPIDSMAAIHAGSFDDVLYERLVAESVEGMERVEFHAAAGDAIVWASNLVHGGAPVLDHSSTRWSQVTHYFFAGATYLTPMHSNFTTGELFLRDPLVDIRSGKPLEHVIGGQEARVLRLAAGRSRIVAPGETVGALDRGLSGLRGVQRRLRWRLWPQRQRVKQVAERCRAH